MFVKKLIAYPILFYFIGFWIYFYLQFLETLEYEPSYIRHRPAFSISFLMVVKLQHNKVFLKIAIIKYNIISIKLEV